MDHRGQSRSRGPDGLNFLTGVAAGSATSVWAAGYFAGGGPAPFQALIAHWDGTAWRQVASPVRRALLYGVAATSAASAWAVGEYD